MENDIKPHLRYAAYVARHKWFVFVAGLKTRAPLWRLIIHDYSKLSPAEWGPYRRRFFAGRSGATEGADPDEWQRAWAHHWHRNAHHWEHWLVLRPGEMPRPMEMPEHFVREMVADWMGAGRAITGKWEAAEWYIENRHKMILAPQTQAMAERLLSVERYVAQTAR